MRSNLIVVAALSDYPIFSVSTRFSETSIARDRQIEKRGVGVRPATHQSPGSRAVFAITNHPAKITRKTRGRESLRFR